MAPNIIPEEIPVDPFLDFKESLRGLGEDELARVSAQVLDEHAQAEQGFIYLFRNEGEIPSALGPLADSVTLPFPVRVAEAEVKFYIVARAIMCRQISGLYQNGGHQRAFGVYVEDGSSDELWSGRFDPERATYAKLAADSVARRFITDNFGGFGTLGQIEKGLWRKLVIEFTDYGDYTLFSEQLGQ